MCKVSIIIPVYNVEKYIEECLVSALNQTLKDIEIICVDDASTDASLEILQSYAEKDSRIKLISYKKNKSASQARKDGVFLANGEYIMFMDGDDFLQSDACEKLYDFIKAKNVDMVQFGTNIINMNHMNEKRIHNLETFLQPHLELLQDKEVFEGCFSEKKYRFTIWNKIYEAGYCKKAFTHVKDGNFPKAQDLYAFFVLCFFAESYCGIEDKYYNYRFGAGITGNSSVSLKQLERYCTSVYVANAISQFTREQAASYQYDAIVKEIRDSLLTDCINQWFFYTSDEIAAQGFDILAKYWNTTEIVSALCRKHYTDRAVIADKIYGADALKIKKKEIHTIGIFYYRMSIGGVQRVISILIPIFMELGYKVVLFTDEIDEENEYTIPAEVERILLPNSLKIKPAEYETRAFEFEKYLKQYNIDVMCYQAASSPKLLFDVILMKMNNVPVIATSHEVPFQNMLTMNVEMTRRPSVFKLLDRLTVLSTTDELYWKNLGINAAYIPNPITETIVKRDLSVIEKNTILWIGRLDSRTKRCLDVVDIMKYVAEEIPDAKLLMVGNEVTPSIKQDLMMKIEKLGVENNVILCGHTTDVDSYYRRAEIHLLTSISETFPMTIVESKQYGMPLVLYELPFVEVCRDNRGFLSVPQGDKKKAAQCIVQILRDNTLKSKLQKDAQDSIISFVSKYDLKKMWSELFLNLYQEEQMVPDTGINLLLKSMLQHFAYGAAIVNNEKAALKKEVTKKQKKLSSIRKKLSAIKKSRSYRIGRGITFLPRKLKAAVHAIKNRG